MNFFNEPYDVQVILGLTLIGVPNSWDEIKLVGFIKSYSYAFGPNEVSIVSTYLEPPNNGIRKAHITCNNLYSKQKLLKIRLIPVITGDSDKYCQIITVRPYCFWIKSDPSSGAIPYMLPKYGSQDISYEMVEAKMLLHKNNIHPSIVTCLMELNLIPTDGLYWTASDAISIWFGIKEQNKKLFSDLEDLFKRVRTSAKKFKPYPYDLDDELIYSSNWNDLLIPSRNGSENCTTWPWETTEQLSPFSSPDLPPKKKPKIPRKIGCVRYESNRQRWVVDLSYEGKRLQKCFHIGYFGLVGGLEQALKWRFEFLLHAEALITTNTELRTLGVIVEKIMLMDIKEEQKYKLLQTLKKTPKGYDSICSNNDIENLIINKLNELNIGTEILNRYKYDMKESKIKETEEDKEYTEESYDKSIEIGEKSNTKLVEIDNLI